MDRRDDYAIEAALQWHPEWRAAYLEDSLDEESHRHIIVHAAVEGMLAGDRKLSAIAGKAERRGIDPHEVRHCLGRALLAGLWYHVHEGTGYDPDVIRRDFKQMLKAATQ